MPMADVPAHVVEELRPSNLEPARTLGERFAVSKALVALFFVDMTMKVTGFYRFHQLVRRFPVASGRSANRATIDRVCRSVDRAAMYYVKRAWCLQRSATTVCLLRRRGVPAEMVIGAERMPFYAHAWVEVDGQVVNDHPDVQRRNTVLERC